MSYELRDVLIDGLSGVVDTDEYSTYRKLVYHLGASIKQGAYNPSHLEQGDYIVLGILNIDFKSQLRSSLFDNEVDIKVLLEFSNILHIIIYNKRTKKVIMPNRCFLDISLLQLILFGFMNTFNPHSDLLVNIIQHIQDNSIGVEMFDE